MTIREIAQTIFTTTAAVVLAGQPPAAIDLHPIWIFLGSTVVCMVAGAATRYREDEYEDHLTANRQLATVLLNMGTLGAVISMLLYSGFRMLLSVGDPYAVAANGVESILIMGVVGLVGFFGMRKLGQAIEFISSTIGAVFNGLAGPIVRVLQRVFNINTKDD